MEIVDLSHILREGLANPRDRPDLDMQLRTIKSVPRDGVQVLMLSVGNHVGTHIDAPAHIIDGGSTLAEIPLQTFFGDASILDMRRAANEAIDAADLASVDDEIREHDIVLICTGWSDRIGSSAYSDEHPFLTPDAAHWLVSRSVRLVGIDVSSVERPFSQRPSGFRHETLRVLLDAGIPAIHNLTGLEALVGKRCQVAAFPVAIAGSDAGLARVVAFVD